MWPINNEKLVIHIIYNRNLRRENLFLVEKFNFVGVDPDGSLFVPICNS